MNDTLGIWDFDGKTGRLALGPAGAAIGKLRLPAEAMALAELRGHVHPDDIGPLADALSHWTAGKAVAIRQTFRIDDGAGQWISIEITGRKSDGEKLSGIWTDVTAEREDITRKDEAVARVHQFAAAASHDLIGPLRHIAMYGDMLLEDFGAGATDEQRQMLKTMSDKARSLQVLTKRLIAFSTDTSAPEFIAVPLDRALANALKRRAGEIELAGARITHGDLPVVVGDPALIEKVFENLVRNAIDWRGDRPLEISVEATMQRRKVVVTVRDNATGIDPRYAGRIFDAFWSLPRPGGVKGAGLGLAVNKTIVNALGGEITLVESTQEGSTFEFVLPLAD